MHRTIATRWYALALLLLVFANACFYSALFAGTSPTATALAVGQGSATLVRAGGATILVDTGADASILRALGEILPPWQRRLDAVILTNSTKAATGGLPALRLRYAITQEITLTRSSRLTLDANTSLDIVITKNAPTGIYFTTMESTTRLR